MNMNKCMNKCMRIRIRASGWIGWIHLRWDHTTQKHTTTNEDHLAYLLGVSPKRMRKDMRRMDHLLESEVIR